MGLVNLVDISKSYDSYLFKDINLQVNLGNKIGIVGLNGSGKTTLLKIIMGEESPTSGSVEKQRGLRVAYVPQNCVFNEEETLIELAFSLHPELSKFKKVMHECEQEMSSPDFKNSPKRDKISTSYSHALEGFESLGGYEFESVLEKQLSRLGLNPAISNKKVVNLSRGELKIAQFAIAFSINPDILFLDEPTNHIDPFSSEIIDGLIKDYGGTMVYVTHDRYLLNKIAGRIVEIKNGSILEFKGTYDDFVEFKETMYAAQMREFQARKQKADQLNISMQAMKSRGKTGHDKEAKKAKILERRIKELRIPKPKEVVDKISVDISTGEMGGQIVLRANGLYKGFSGQDVLLDTNIEIVRGQRIGIVGKNGSGRTTLLNCLLGRDSLDNGVVWMGPSTQVGYLSQLDISLQAENTIYDELYAAGCRDVNSAYGMLGAWLFRDSDINQKIGVLSGGEKKKVQLMKIMLTKPNLLVLDEPTDHLDMVSREALESAVSEFPGTIVTASQDRYFLDRVTDSILLLNDGTVTKMEGNYSYNLRRITEVLARKK